jgi:hypothetical protein
MTNQISSNFQFYKFRISLSKRTSVSYPKKILILKIKLTHNEGEGNFEMTPHINVY